MCNSVQRWLSLMVRVTSHVVSSRVGRYCICDNDLPSTAAKKYNELFPKQQKKEKKEKKDGGAEKQEKQPQKKKDKPKEEVVDDEEDDDIPKAPKFKDPYCDLPKRFARPLLV